MAEFRFEKLDVWQKAIDFADSIYASTASFPNDERFGLVNQLRRAAVFVSSNLAEGCSRTPKDFARFVQMGYGSVMEIVSQLRIATRQRFLTDENEAKLRDSADELARMLSGLRSRLLRGDG